MRHDGGAEHADGVEDAAAADLGEEGVEGDKLPGGVNEGELGGVAEADGGDEADDSELELAEAAGFQREQGEDEEGGEQRGEQEGAGARPAVVMAMELDQSSTQSSW